MPSLSGCTAHRNGTERRVFDFSRCWKNEFHVFTGVVGFRSPQQVERPSTNKTNVNFSWGNADSSSASLSDSTPVCFLQAQMCAMLQTFLCPHQI